VSPYIHVLSASVMLALAAWIRRSGAERGEPARYLVVWLALSAAASLIMAASQWVEDETVSLSFAAAARSLGLMGAFIAFVFTRSFSRSPDSSLYFWSLPLQLGLASNILNWERIYRLEGRTWVLRAGDSLALAVAVAIWFYYLLALLYALLLYSTLKKEGKEMESRRTLVMTLGLLLLMAAGSLGGMVNGVTGHAAVYGSLGYLAGVLSLVWAFGFPLASGEPGRWR